MLWNDHRKDIIAGSHAFLSPSGYHWLNYTNDKLLSVYNNLKAAEEGTKMHGIAKMLIEEKIKLPRKLKTLNMYVNDSIDHGMDPEVQLKYSDFCYGTADAIQFYSSEKKLRIHDLKTGKVKASFHQLEIYAALFFLEYDIPPGSVEVELKIYQNDLILVPDYVIGADIIVPIMDTIIRFDKILSSIA